MDRMTSQMGNGQRYAVRIVLLLTATNAVR